jgi:ribonucleoside-diphosphate reductase beta chain
MAGNWNKVWSSFDARRKAKGDIAGANDLEVDAGSEPDMFAGGVNAAE